MHTCDDCQGSGEVLCQSCGGSGLGDGDDGTCEDCDGNGAVTCDTCEGTGEIADEDDD